MAVIVRESKIIDCKKFNDIKVYKSDNFPISVKEELNAEKLDDFISNFFNDLIKDVKKKNLLKLKGSRGVINLWYYVGKKLEFIDKPQIVDPKDKKYIWMAIWFHSGDLAPGEAKTRAGTIRDHFSYCYRLAKYDKEFVLNAGNWRNWMDFFDSPTLNNKIFLGWFEKKTHIIKSMKIKNWLREFIKLIRNEFQNIDMSFLNKEEIESRCNKILKDFISKN